MYIDKPEKVKIGPYVLPTTMPPLKRLRDASTSSRRRRKRRKTAPSSKDGPHILHSYRLEHLPFNEDQAIEADDSSESSSSESEPELDPDSDARWEKEFLLGAPGTRGESVDEGKDTAKNKSPPVQTNSQPETAVDMDLKIPWEDPSQDTLETDIRCFIYSRSADGTSIMHAVDFEGLPIESE